MSEQLAVEIDAAREWLSTAMGRYLAREIFQYGSEPDQPVTCLQCMTGSYAKGQETALGGLNEAAMAKAITNALQRLNKSPAAALDALPWTSRLMCFACSAKNGLKWAERIGGTIHEVECSQCKRPVHLGEFRLAARGVTKEAE